MKKNKSSSLSNKEKMKLCEISRMAATTWCPLPTYSNYIACGSIAGSLENFTAGSKLEIFTIDPSSAKTISGEGEDMLIGSVSCADRFNKLAWGKPSGDYEMGTVAGALVDGTISLYDASKIVGNKDQSADAVIVNLEKHTAPVRGLEFNPTQTNLLASAGEDSNLYIWNMKNPSSPSLVALGGKNPHQNQSISALAWNRIFEYILATTSYNGTSVVWDLKQKRPIVPFTNSQNRKRYSSLAWNPEVPTQLVTASEDDNSPVIELWDLRNAYAPLKEYNGHSKGILSVSWCPDDSNLLVSCGKDNRTLIWNPNTGEILGELPTSNNWVFDVQWSKRPSILSTASFDGKISVISLQDSSANVVEVGDFAKSIGMDAKPTIQKNVFKTAPKWLQRPAGAAFGFGGSLAVFGKGSKKLTIYSVPSDLEVAERSLALEKALETKKYVEFCDRKIQTAKDEDLKSVWSVIKVLFEVDRGASLLNYLGFDKEAIKQEVEAELSKEKEKAESDEATQVKSKLNLSAGQVDELIRKSVLVQNYENAVDLALKAGRIADALILSTCGGASLWEKTRQEYFNLQTRKDMKIIACMLNNKVVDIVDEADLDDWKSALSVIASCQNPQQFKQLCDKLAYRLENEKGDTFSATLCYILSGNIEKVIPVWVKKVISARNEQSGIIPTDQLLDFIEQVTLFKVATNSSDQQLLDLQPDITLVYTQYGQLLSQQGPELLPVALRYLNIVSHGQESPEIAALRYRVYHSVVKPFGPVPNAPFEIKEPQLARPVSQPSPATKQQPARGLTHATSQPTAYQPTKVGPHVPMGIPPSTVTGSSFRQHPIPDANVHMGVPPPTGSGPSFRTPTTENVPYYSGYGVPRGASPPPHMPQTMSGSSFGVPSPQMGHPPVTQIGPPPTSFPSRPISEPGPINGPNSNIPLPTGTPFQPSSTFSQTPTQPSVPLIGTAPMSGQFTHPSPHIPLQTSATSPSPSFKPISSPPPSDEVPSEVLKPLTKSEEQPAPKVSSGDYVKIIETMQATFDHVFSGDVPTVVKSKKRMIENGISALSKQLNEKNLNESLLNELLVLSNAIENNDMKTANASVQKITKEHWEQSKDFIKGIKFLLSLLKK
jgi:protein transport protein SEC31